MFCSGRKINDVNERISDEKILDLAAALTMALIQAFCTISNMSWVY